MAIAAPWMALGGFALIVAAVVALGLVAARRERRERLERKVVDDALADSASKVWRREVLS